MSSGVARWYIFIFKKGNIWEGLGIKNVGIIYGNLFGP
jgi:hypothetical protein